MPIDDRPDEKFFDDAKKVIDAITGKRFCTWVQTWTGQKFNNKAETVERYIRDRKAGDEHDDKLIRRFLYQSDVGRLATDTFDFGHADVTEITSAIKAPDVTRTTREVFKGVYLAYHASYVLPDRYVVRAFEFVPTEDGIGVRDFLTEEMTAETPQELRGAGAVAVHDNRPVILLRRTDNAIGFKAIQITQVQSGGNAWMAGQMSGINRKNEAFSRTVVFRRFRGTIEEAKRHTGIFPRAQASSDDGLSVVLKAAKSFEHTVNNQDWVHALAWPKPEGGEVNQPA